MNNQTFTHKDGSRPREHNRRSTEATRKIRSDVTAYMRAFEIENGKPPTRSEVSRHFGIELHKATIVMQNIRNAGLMPKTRQSASVALPGSVLRYVRCVECGDTTCARSVTSETVKGWRDVSLEGGTGVCHKCAKATSQKAVAK